MLVTKINKKEQPCEIIYLLVSCIKVLHNVYYFKTIRNTQYKFNFYQCLVQINAKRIS